jgi:hypothetical protein
MVKQKAAMDARVGFKIPKTALPEIEQYLSDYKTGKTLSQLLRDLLERELRRRDYYHDQIGGSH